MSQIIEWFKTSIPGIIILGALGSILALILLKLGRWLFNKVINSAYSRLFFPLILKPYYFDSSLTHRLLKSDDKTKLLVYAGWKLGNFAITTALLFVMIGIDSLYFALTETTFTFASFILVTSTILVLRMWIADVMGAIAVRTTLLENDYKAVEEQIDKLKEES